MEFLLPINERKTKELLNIISNNDKWAKEVQILAEEELYRRNFTKEEIEHEKLKREQTLKMFRKRRNDILVRNKDEGYTIPQMMAIIAFFPFSFFVHINSLTKFEELSAGNYQKKIRQRIVLIAVSLLLWFQLLRLII